MRRVTDQTTDILIRLRERAKIKGETNGSPLLLEAASEIERLRRLVATLKQVAELTNA